MGDVLIKNMEMPDRCFACPLCDVIDSEVNCVISHGSYIEYREISEQTAINGRPSDCPLVFVPPHGRLIDADALNYTTLYKENWMRGTGVEAPAVWKKDIEDAPTIIPAEDGES